MSDTMLLTFRWGKEKYGIPLEDISGLSSNISDSDLVTTGSIRGVVELPQNPLLLFDMDSVSASDKNRRIILLRTKGLQLALLVDEVLSVERAGEEPGAETASFQLWRLPDERGEH